VENEDDEDVDAIEDGEVDAEIEKEEAEEKFIVPALMS
jgi:hypothetical protein